MTSLKQELLKAELAYVMLVIELSYEFSKPGSHLSIPNLTFLLVTYSVVMQIHNLLNHFFSLIVLEMI